MADAGASYVNEEERGRRPKDSGADHTREFSPKETTQKGGYQRPYRGENSRYDQGGGGNYQSRNYNQQNGGNYHNRDGQQFGRGHPHYQRDNSHPGGQRGRGYFHQGQNWHHYDRQGSREGRQHSEWQENRGGQRGHYNERNQREYNTEGRQGSYGGRKRRWDNGGNRQYERNFNGPPHSYDTSRSKRDRNMSDFDSHCRKRQNQYYFKDEDPVVFLSKKLSFILRHGAEKMGFKLMPGGFLWVRDILRRNEYNDFTLDDIKRVVETNDKQRFSLVQDENGEYKIRANQGHSLEVDGLELTPITDAKDAPEVIHGTYFSSWNIIKEEGLNKMGRNHIHFAAGEPGENGVISGMRSSCEVIIKLNIEKALNSGIKFFRSANNVILSPGDKDGFIRPCFFDSALTRYPRSILSFNKEVQEGPSIPGLSKEMMKKTKKGKKKNKGKQNPNEKNVDREQEDNMEECTSMFDSEGVQETEEETKYGFPSGPVSENLEEKAETDKIENAMSSSEPQEVPETWEDETETKEGENPQSPSKPKEFTEVTDEDCCISAMDSLREGPVFVFCHLDDGNITSVSCVSRTGAYNFSKELLKEGGVLRKLLDDSGPPRKIYNNIAETSKALFDQYSILLDGTDVFDNRVALDYVTDQGEGNLNELPSEFDPEPWGTMKVDAELLQKSLVSLEAFSLLSVWADKKVKKSLFYEVNKEIDPEKLKAEKEKRKQAKKKEAASNVQQDSPKNQGKSNKKRKNKT